MNTSYAVLERKMLSCIAGCIIQKLLLRGSLGLKMFIWEQHPWEDEGKAGLGRGSCAAGMQAWQGLGSPDWGFWSRCGPLECPPIGSEWAGFLYAHLTWLGFPGGSNGKESVCNARDLGSMCGLGTSLGEGNGYPLQYSCLENPMDRGAWQATVHGVTKSQTRLSN